MSQREIKPLKKYWMCVLKDGYPHYLTISSSRGGSIEKLELNNYTAWKELRKAGYTCVKVNISFEELNHKGN